MNSRPRNDLPVGHTPKAPTELMTSAYRESNFASFLTDRAFGFCRRRRKRLPVNEDLQPWKSWKGASSDVIRICWSPDGTRFAAGATTQCDDDNMQYNRNRNLILGDVVSSRLKELPDHRIKRPLRQGDQTSAAAQLLDPYIYMSVNHTQWIGDSLYTSGFDHTVKVWDVTSHDDASCVKTLNHPGRLQVVHVSDSGLVATGCLSNDTSPFNLWSLSEKDPTPSPLHIHTKIQSMLDPSSLKWGNSSAPNYLAAGMAAQDKSDSFDPPKEGYLTLWHIRECAEPISLSDNLSNTFDISWHPSLPIFATGSSKGRVMGLGKDIRSIVRVYQPLAVKYPVLEFSCPGLDINEVSFCPTDARYVIASCTDGVTYVFDHRNTGKTLHRLSHDSPISPWAGYYEGATREQADFGVQLSLWKDKDRLLTGSTDGVLKEWNIFRSPEDVLTKDVISIGGEITSGAFSRDHCNLAVGDGSGAVHILSDAPFPNANNSTFNFEERLEPSFIDDQNSSLTGVSIGQSMMASGELSRHPLLGAVQGPNYGRGRYTKHYWAQWARPRGTPISQMATTPLNEDIRSQQLLNPDFTKLNSEMQRFVSLQTQIAALRNKARQHRKRKRNFVPEQPLTLPFHPASITKTPEKSPTKPSDSQHHDIIDNTMVSPTTLDTHKIQQASPVSMSDKFSEKDGHRVKVLVQLPPNFYPDTYVTLPDTMTTEDQGQDTDNSDDLVFLSSKTRSNRSPETMEDDLTDDYWFPCSGDVDPNLD